MTTVLITGAYGFLGRHTAQLFKKHGWLVLGMGHGHWDFENPADFGIDRWIEADIDFYTLQKINERLDCVVHCAGGSSVNHSIQYPLHDFNKTVTASINLLEYIRIHQPQAKFIYPSSAAVYGKKTNVPIKVKDLLNPISPYGFHKKIVEELCSSYSTNFSLTNIVIRFFSIYGPNLKKQLLWDACNKLSKSKGDVTFFGTGEETRDWIHVKDAAELIFCSAKSMDESVTINGGSGEIKPTKEIIKLIASQFKNNKHIVFNQESREGDPKHYWADISKAKSKNWHPKIRIEDGLKEYVEWFKEQQ